MKELTEKEFLESTSKMADDTTNTLISLMMEMGVMKPENIDDNTVRVLKTFQHAGIVLGACMLYHDEIETGLHNHKCVLTLDPYVITRNKLKPGETFKD